MQRLNSTSGGNENQHWSIYTPTLTYGHRLWVVTKTGRARDKSGGNELSPKKEIGWGVQLSGRGSESSRYSSTSKGLSWDGLGNWQGCQLGEVFWTCPTGGETMGHTQDTLERLYLLTGLGMPLCSEWTNWRRWPGRGRSGLSLGCCLSVPAPDKQK